jgi:hypothetical protein
MVRPMAQRRGCCVNIDDLIVDLGYRSSARLKKLGDDVVTIASYANR